MTSVSDADIAPPQAPELAGLPRVRLESMLRSGEEILECYRVLGKAGLNIVGELLRGQGTFYEYDHYPQGDVFDDERHSQYDYHAPVTHATRARARKNKTAAKNAASLTRGQASGIAVRRPSCYAMHSITPEPLLRRAASASHRGWFLSRPLTRPSLLCVRTAAP